MENITAEAIFGGIVLIFVLGLIFTGKLRLEREVKEKDLIIEYKNNTIREQSATIKTLTQQAEVTNNFLKEIRNAAYNFDDHHVGNSSEDH